MLRLLHSLPEGKFAGDSGPFSEEAIMITAAYFSCRTLRWLFLAVQFCAAADEAVQANQDESKPRDTVPN
jgi:hypothetical protein